MASGPLLPGIELPDEEPHVNDTKALEKEATVIYYAKDATRIVRALE